MYAFINVQVEGEPDEIVKAYHEFTELVKVQPQGLPDKDFRAILDDLMDDQSISGDPGDVDEKMSPQQKLIINEVKKSIKRLNK